MMKTNISDALIRDQSCIDVLDLYRKLKSEVSSEAEVGVAQVFLRLCGLYY